MRIIEGYKLSSQQKAIFTSVRESKAQPCVAGIMEVESRVRPELMRAALRRVIDEQEILRTTFVVRGGLKFPLQNVRDGADCTWLEFDPSSLAPSSRSSEVERIFRDGVNRSFDLGAESPVQASLIRLSEIRWLLMVRITGLCADAVTATNLLRACALAYGSSPEQDNQGFTAIQYADYAGWQEELLAAENEQTRQGKTYWMSKVSQWLGAISLPALYDEPVDGLFMPRSAIVNLDRVVQDRIAVLAEETGTSERAVLLACWLLLLRRLSNQEQVCAAYVADGRDDHLRSAFGMYARRLPLCLDVNLNFSFRSLTSETSNLIKAMEKWQDYFIPDQTMAERSPCEFEYLEHEDDYQAGESSFYLSRIYSCLGAFSLKLFCRRTANQLSVEMYYNNSGMDDAGSMRLVSYYQTLLDSATSNPDNPVDWLRILDDASRAKLLVNAAGPERGATGNSCIHELIEAQALATPDRVAVVSEAGAYTYSYLSAKSNRIAHCLRLEYGVGLDDPVGLLCGRSFHWIAGMLGILKAGGAYVPLDAEAPPEHLRAQIASAAVKLVITEQALLAKLSVVETPVLVLNGAPAYIDRYPETNPGCHTHPENLCYAILTSGSTGIPKAVCISHSALVNYCHSISDQLELSETGSGGLSFGIVSSLNADLCNTMLFPGLLAGGTLHLISRDVATDADRYSDYLRSHEIDGIKIVPSHFAALLQPEFSFPRKYLIFGGEALRRQLISRVQSLDPGCLLVNHYGPTEATVGAILHKIEQAQASETKPGTTIPIGRPIANTQAYVLDERMEPVPLGVEGELYLGGKGLARGYLRRGDLTAASFVPHPLSEEVGARLYRTGDVVRYREDGELEYVGRRDEQVKIRGYRIETGEIEAVLQQHEQVRMAAVVVREKEGGEKRLEAYVEVEPGAGVREEEIGEYLRERLPVYMQPGRIKVIEQIPLTSNGKVDRKQLLERKWEEVSRREYRGASTEEEEKLVEIWREVLKQERVGIDDNFFELGGDSILSIQVVARAKQAGLQLTPREVFQHPTIAQLAGRRAITHLNSADQGIVEGAVPLTPIQRWFFGQRHDNPHHWNQAVVLRLREEIKAEVLEEAINKLIIHHDALRMRFRKSETGWEQENQGVGRRVRLTIHDLEGVDETQQKKRLEEEAKRIQEGMNITRGPMVAGSVFELGRGERRLVIVIHHLVVDGVSWRILLEDMQTICRQLSKGEEASLPAKTTSYKEWAERVAEYAKSEEVREEISYWLEKCEKPYGKVPVDHNKGENNVGSGEEVSEGLSEEETQELLQRVPAAYRCSISEALMGSLVRTLRKWTGEQPVRVEMESHGREELLGEVDVTRTVGWFTTRAVVQVNPDAGASIATAIKEVKEELRGMKRHGMGYGMLRYLGGEELEKRVGESGTGEVSFNYLGQLDQVLGEEAMFELGQEEIGSPQDEKGRRSNIIQINSRISGGRLHVSWNYSRTLHGRVSIEQVSRRYRTELRELITDARRWQGIAYTPSDFPLARMSEKELMRVVDEEGEVEDIYRLSGVQQGMLFHTLYAPGTGIYVGQMTCRVKGELREEAFTEAWERVVERHEAMRTSYVWEGVGEMVQVVRKGAKVEVEVEEWEEKSESERQKMLDLEIEKDRRRGFDLRKAPLMRMKLIRLAEREWQVVWTNHHIILDGWSRPILLNDFFSFYQAMVKGRSLSLGGSRPYRDYIDWLERQDKEGARKYWESRLAGFEGCNRLRIDRGAGSREPGGEDRKKRQRELGIEVTRRLMEIGREHSLTMNTLLQGAWAIVLSHYTRERDIVYGAVVSGRPAELAGVETIVGLFINTLPVRVKVESGGKLIEWLKQQQEAHLEMLQYEHTPLGQIQSWAKVPADKPLFETLFVFENFPSLIQIPEDSKVEVSELRAFDQNNYPLTLTVIPRENCICEITYASVRFSEPDIELMLSDLTRVIEEMTSDPNATFEQIEGSLNKVLPYAEQKKTSENAPARPKSFRPVIPKAYDLIDPELVKAELLHPDKSLPLVLRPTDIKVNLIQWARDRKDFILESLWKHGAVLFRGFAIDPATDFEPLARTLTTSLLHDNGEHNRESVSGSVYTPVFYPPGRMLLWHNENSFNYQWPTKIWFACAAPASQGGEMLLVDSRRVYELISPTIRDRFTERGISYVRNYRRELGLEWQKVFGTTKKEEVERYCRENRMQFEWKNEDRLKTTAIMPAIIRHPQTGEISWFNQAQHWHVACLDPETLRSLLSVFTPDEFPRHCYYGDGAEIDDATMYELCEIYKSIEVPVAWQRGDILLIDNVLTAHGRNPFVGPRKMFVAMGDMSEG